jgi:hypothetical protein
MLPIRSRKGLLIFSKGIWMMKLGYYIELGLGYWSSMEGEYPVLRIV